MRLEWKGDATIPPRFAVQTKHVRHEPVYYYLMTHRVEDHRALCNSDIKTGFFGRGGKAKVKAAAQRLADLVDEA